jgi:hypothetical protein
VVDRVKEEENVWWLLKNPPSPLQRDWWWTGLKKRKISGGSWRIPPSLLQKRWVVNRVKEGENIWWFLKNPPSPPFRRDGWWTGLKKGKISAGF